MHRLKAELLVPRNRLDALTDGVYAITVTLLVLELSIPAVDLPGTEGDLVKALMTTVPKITVWVLSFWITCLFWISGAKIGGFSDDYDGSAVKLELFSLALISLVPFSTSIMGQYYNYKTTAIIYSLHLFSLSILSAVRTIWSLKKNSPAAKEWHISILQYLKMRTRIVPICTGFSLILAFFTPGWNMIAIFPLFFVPVWPKKHPVNGR